MIMYYDRNVYVERRSYVRTAPLYYSLVEKEGRGGLQERVSFSSFAIIASIFGHGESKQEKSENNLLFKYRMQSGKSQAR